MPSPLFSLKCCHVLAVTKFRVQLGALRCRIEPKLTAMTSPLRVRPLLEHALNVIPEVRELLHLSKAYHAV